MLTPGEIAIAVKALLALPALKHAGRRAMLDVVEYVATQRPAQVVPAKRRLEVSAAALIVLEGSVTVVNGGRDATLQAGEAWVHDLLAGDQPLIVRTVGRVAARVFVLVSGDLARGLGRAAVARSVGVLPRVHAILLTADPGPRRRNRPPLEAVGRLLGASLVEQFDEQVVLIVLDDRGGRAGLVVDRECVLQRIAEGSTVTDIARALVPAPVPKFVHAIVVHQPAALGALPDGMSGERFDRILWFPDPKIGARIPVELLRRLKPLVSDGHRFSSLIPVDVVPPDDGGAPRAAGLLGIDLLGTMAYERLATLTLRPSGFDSEPVGTMRFGPVSQGRLARLQRDTCRVAFDLVALRARWTRWSHWKSPPPFVGWLTAGWPEDAARCHDAAARLARAVTSRQVGIALSGGGAFSFRLIPFLKRLLGAVPIDLVGSVSGGSLLAAYMIADGSDGLDFCARQGLWFMGVASSAPFDSAWIEALVDAQLGGRRVEHTVPRFVPLTTALLPEGPPASHVVTAGTLGEAVRVSGAAPIFYSPVKKGDVHFADGFTAAAIPVRALWDFGADCVFACNSIPGADRRNPFSALPGALGLLGNATYRYAPFAGRFIDGFVSMTTLLENVSREAGADADEFVAVDPTPFPMVQAFRFDEAEEIAREGETDPTLIAAAQRCIDFWETFRKREPRIG